MEISEKTGFAKRQTALTLEELVLAKIVVSETVGNRTVYSLRHTKQLDSLLGKPAHRDPPWQKLAAATHAILALRDKSTRVQQVRIAAVLREHALPDVNATLDGWVNYLQLISEL
ncbi:MAG: hypothetical protein AAFU77_16980 [Myxococcota bacterium]